MSSYIENIGKRAKLAAKEIQGMSVKKRNEILIQISELLANSVDFIQIANNMDVEKARENQLTEAMIDRLVLSTSRIEGMIHGLKKMKAFKDPLGASVQSWTHENNMVISQVTVPLGVVGMIYESRPNVTVDVSGLCIKSGNCVILRGGSEAIHTNKALVEVIRKAIEKCDVNPDIVQLVTETDREHVKALLQMNAYVDVIIPRGGRGLKKAVIRDASVPVIETGEGLCHTYVDESADLEMALDIILNAKTQRTGVCNAMETLLVHESISKSLLPLVDKALDQKGFEIRGCDVSMPYLSHGIRATEEDWATEYLDAILSIKVVRDLKEAIEHINQYGSGHSEAIVTSCYDHAEKFLNQVDAACVYVNASTRFTDGDVFGFGGEVGISTQKLHARGPMGLEALTSKKYMIRGNGQIRN